MQTISLFPGYTIMISEKRDGDFRLREHFPDIYRPIRQEHGTKIHILTEDNRSIAYSDCDGTYTRCKDTAIAAMGADCPCIAILGIGECAVVHSGWRGTKEHIIQHALDLFSTPREELIIYISPHISIDSYYVGEDFLENFPIEYFVISEGKHYFDLGNYIIDDCIAFGLKETNIHSHGADTFTGEQYFSYRRDGMIGVGVFALQMSSIE